MVSCDGVITLVVMDVMVCAREQAPASIEWGGGGGGGARDQYDQHRHCPLLRYRYLASTYRHHGYRPYVYFYE